MLKSGQLKVGWVIRLVARGTGKTKIHVVHKGICRSRQELPGERSVRRRVDGLVKVQLRMAQDVGFENVLG